MNWKKINVISIYIFLETQLLEVSGEDIKEVGQVNLGPKTKHFHYNISSVLCC